MAPASAEMVGCVKWSLPWWLENGTPAVSTQPVLPRQYSYSLALIMNDLSGDLYKIRRR